MVSPTARASYKSAGTPQDVDKRASEAGVSLAVPVPTSGFKKFYFGIPGILTGALLGVIFGVLLQKAHPSAVAISWIGLPGSLFIRAVKCMVTPVVFCSLIVGMDDMLRAGKAGKIGWRTILIYVGTTIAATIEGLAVVSIFRNSFGNRKKAQEANIARFALACKPGYYLTHMENNTLSCLKDEIHAADPTKFSEHVLFNVTDVNKSFTKTASEFVKRTLTEALQSQFNSLVPSNITQAFADANLLSIVMFAIPFGIAMAMLPKKMRTLSNFIREANDICMRMIKWIIMCTPVAIISLLMSSISQQKDLKMLVSDVVLLEVCEVLGLAFHALVFYPVLLRSFVKCNPYAWINKMTRALVFAFGSASSMATLPVVMECMDETRMITQTVSRFVLSLGATIGMDGAAITYPIAIVFMAEAEGLGHIIGGVEYVLIVLVSTIGAIGSGPVPASSIVMTMTIWTSVFPSVPLPSTFAFIVATDWFNDRCHTMVNVLDDTIVTRIVANAVGETLDPDAEQQMNDAAQHMEENNDELREAREALDALKHSEA